jgi:hypothetical protein
VTPCHHRQVPRPFVAYLRVYEPLSAFDGSLADRIKQSMSTGPLPRARVGDRERELWLRSQLTAPPRLLPGDGPDGGPAPNAPRDVLVLNRFEVPGADRVTESGSGESGSGESGSGESGSGESGPGESGPAAGELAGQPAGAGADPLVCPLDLRPRSATALAGFLSTATGPLVEATISQPAETAKSRAAAVMAELASNAMHAISATWTVPLPWFALVDPEARQLVLAPVDDPDRQVSWRATITDAQQRVARAYSVVSKAIGEEGPARVLRDTGRWLEHFHPDSAVELDYGGLVQLMDDNTLLNDDSAADVHAIVDALEEGDAEQVAEIYERLRDFWGELAARERFG